MPKRQSAGTPKDPKRYARPASPVTASAGAPSHREYCEKIEEALNERIRRRCATKEFTNQTGACAAGQGETAAVDLVIVIDTSGSMTDEATALSAAADAAIQASAQSCPSDLRVAWFGIEGTWANTNFAQTYRDYLGLPDSQLVATPGDSEDGAGAVIDLSDHFDWRTGASRAIFYLGDEALEGGDPQNADDVAAADAAIVAATDASVTVFTYFGTNQANPNPVTPAEYARIATSTGGQAYTAPVANLGGFQAVLEAVICNAPAQICRDADLPELKPCIQLSWGDGPKDNIETDDEEVLCITVCNPYSNVVLEDFTLSLVVTGPGQQPVASLPDGTDSVMVRPDYLIQFGDVASCGDHADGEMTCVSRQVVMLSRGAAPGPYELHTIQCFNARFDRASHERFDLELVRS